LSVAFKEPAISSVEDYSLFFGDGGCITYGCFSKTLLENSW